MESSRSRARELAKESLRRGDASGWFEELYVEAAGNAATIPWADQAPNPNLLSWLAARESEGKPLPGDHQTALVVGCGLGDDAEHLASLGLKVTAFDVSSTAIAWCRRRFPVSPVTYEARDLFQAPAAWRRAFDFVFEAYTLQVLSADVRAPAFARIAEWVSPKGLLLVIARGREPSDPVGEMPWPLTRDELSAFERAGLVVDRFEVYLDGENPPVRRFRIVYRRLPTAD